MYGDFGFVNNVIFNWWNRSADGGDNKSMFNFINNYYKPGPVTPLDKPIGHRILKPESGRDKANAANFGKAYVSGNVIEGNEQVTNDNWAGGVQLEDTPDELSSLQKIRVNDPMPMAKVSIIPAREAYRYVLENVGATLPKRDAVDTRIVTTVRTGKINYVEGKDTVIGSQFIKRRLPQDSYKMGIITTPEQVGGYPEYKGTAYKDTDNDGIPDTYETNHGLNPKDRKDAVVINKSGYSNIEVYLNSLVDIHDVIPVLQTKTAKQ
jgi:hypothetical protein